MPNYTLNDGRRAIIDGRMYEAGEKVTLDTEQADPLVASGVLSPVKRGRPPAGKRSAWTHPGDDDEDDQEG